MSERRPVHRHLGAAVAPDRPAPHDPAPQASPLARAWHAGLRRGDPLADAFAADLAALGHGAAMRSLHRAIADGIAAVPDAPRSLVDLFDHLDAEPDWVDHEQLDRACHALLRNSLQFGLVLGAASLTVGYTNPVAARPLVLTGRLVQHSGVRNLEVGDWLREVTAPGGLRREGLGFERTVRVRVIHAMVRRRVGGRDDWDHAAWGVPVCQSYLSHTLSEFGSIALRGMHRLGARYADDELTDIAALWRYVGHLSGVEEPLLPRTIADQVAIEEIYQRTRPPADDGSRALTSGLLTDYLVPEIVSLLPPRLPLTDAARRRLAHGYVHGLVRSLIGDDLADELGVEHSWFEPVVTPLGHATAAAYWLCDRVPGGADWRVRRGLARNRATERRLRERHRMAHSMVDDAPPLHA